MQVVARTASKGIRGFLLRFELFYAYMYVLARNKDYHLYYVLSNIIILNFGYIIRMAAPDTN